MDNRFIAKGTVLTCKLCIHFKRCEWLIGLSGNESSCDWEPSKFQYIHTTTHYAINVHTLSKHAPTEEKIY